MIQLGPSEVTCCWDRYKLDFRKETPSQPGPFVPWRVLASCLSSLLCCFALWNLHSVSFRMPGPGMNLVPFHISFSLLPLHFLSILHPPLVLYFFFHILFNFFLRICSSPNPLFYFILFFVKPSSFKIKWWSFGWGNNAFLNKIPISGSHFFISGNVRNHYFRLWKCNQASFWAIPYQMQKLFCSMHSFLLATYLCKVKKRGREWERKLRFQFPTAVSYLQIQGLLLPLDAPLRSWSASRVGLL